MKCCEVGSSSFCSYFSLFLYIRLCVPACCVQSKTCVSSVRLSNTNSHSSGLSNGGLRHEGEMRLFSAPKCKP